ncbi:MAG: thiamine ABC transporter substrate binding subunit [Acidimicrobiales bacterium]
MTRPRPPRGLAAALVALLLVALAACGDDDSAKDAGDADFGCAAPSGDGSDEAPDAVRLLTHDSFALSDGVLDAFTEATGIDVDVIQGGDAGTVVNQAILTNGKPQADVLYGIDSTFLSRALDERLFVAHDAEGLDEVDDALVLDPDHCVTPIDYGDVCINYDKAYFEEHHLEVPRSLDDLTDPAYKDLLVVENPATSSPGLAFLLATVEAFGEDGWEQWWGALRDDGVEVVDGWEEAYYSSFSGGLGSEGERPLVVSYASSPPAEVVYADPPVDDAPTGVMDSSCYRQVEFAGILNGTRHEAAAAELVDFLLSKRVQADVPLSMFVFPARDDVDLPPEFVRYAATPDDPFELAPADIDANRDDWIERWTDVVLR